ncbi:OsmC family protein [Lactobacillus ultunensis]|uniref:OsmC-like protein n=1 Tax=Lactobacillus ultunensis DSM 16047 TaxID=525365 RepID=C2ER64_9LACO|nr:OsmC family protein [Lactobacillus ultunensis]EEJ70953.1 OsmC-like protein [Lactobacillus ultunensis DSM 16047]QQP28976.1 OsmC family protein [Lactobacillus ultunensis]
MCKDKYQIKTMKTDLRLQVEASIRDINFKIDEPEFNGGDDTGITPVELELTALGASLQEKVEKYAAENNFKYQDLNINIEGDIDLDGMHGNPDIPNGFQAIRVNFVFKTEENANRVNEVIKAAINSSPIYKILNKKSKVENVIEESDYHDYLNFWC